MGLLLVASIILVPFAALIWFYMVKIYPLKKALNQIPSPPTRFIFGNILIFYDALRTGLDFYRAFVQFLYGFCIGAHQFDLVMIWICWQPIVVLFKPENVEPVLSNNNELSKAVNYNNLHPWLGTGLLTSTGNKWRSRRKLLTPAFHFRILDDFIPIFNDQSKIMIKKLSEVTYIDDITPYITTCTLDIICETAMGTTVKAQQNPKSDYVEAIYLLGESFMKRQIQPHMWWKPIFMLTSYGKSYYRALNTLHSFTRQVISERKKEMIQPQTKNVSGNTSDEEFFGVKKRKAFLDLLLQYNLDGAGLTEEDIREEVDTFMFEGHDTTSMGICWSLYLIGLDAKVQAKIHDELDSIFGDDTERPINAEDLSKLKYVECCIKEALRLFPSVPLIARELDNDIEMFKHTIPKGTTVAIIPYMLHRDPRHFPMPEKFDPDRFSADNVIGRHPYAYIPFSAGPRNCIGQKFALMEEKILLAQVFRNFEIQSLDTREHVPIAIELVTRPKAPLRFRLRKRYRD